MPPAWSEKRKEKMRLSKCTPNEIGKQDRMNGDSRPAFGALKRRQSTMRRRRRATASRRC